MRLSQMYFRYHLFQQRKGRYNPLPKKNKENKWILQKKNESIFLVLEEF